MATVIHEKSLGDTMVCTVDADPNGSIARPIGSTAKLEDGPAEWRNTDGGTTWERTDVGAWSEALLEQITRCVDSINTDPNPDGTEANPFTTIQAAVDDIAAISGIATNPAQRTVRVIGGRDYDEAVTIPQADAGVWTLIAEVFAFIGLIPASPRNVSRIADPAAKITGINPTLSLLTEGPGAWIVSGGIVLSDTGAGQEQSFTIGGSVVGMGVTYAIDATGMTALLNLLLKAATVVGPINAPTAKMLSGNDNALQGAVTVENIEEQGHSKLAAVTVTSAGSGYLKDCQISGTWTGPASSFRVDHSTLGAFGGSLAGGATVVLLDSHGDKHTDGTDDITLDGASLSKSVSGLKVADTRVRTIPQVNGFLYFATRTVLELNAESPTGGELAVVTGAGGTPTAPGSDALVAGDVAEFSAGWKKIASQVGGFPPAGFRALVASTALGYTLYAPATGHAGEIAEWDGTSLTPVYETPVAGMQVSLTGSTAYGPFQLYFNPSPILWGTSYTGALLGDGLGLTSGIYLIGLQLADSSLSKDATGLRVADLGITADNVAAANKDGGVGVPSMRTLGAGAQQAAAGSHGAQHTDGTDDVADLIGDSGAGGVHGLVPAPGAGDAAAGKFLKADGTWDEADVTGAANVRAALASVSGDTAVALQDDSATAFAIKQGVNNYLLIDTANGAEVMSFGNATTNPDFAFLGSGSLGFFGTAPAAQQDITGSRGGNAALASLLTGLANLGLITDSSS